MSKSDEEKRAKKGSRDYGAVVAAMNDALAQFSHDIASKLEVAL